MKNEAQYHVIGLTHNNMIVAICDQHICYFNLMSEEMLTSKQMPSGEFIYADKHVVVMSESTVSQTQHLHLYRLDDMAYLKTLQKDTACTLVKVSNTATYMALQNGNTIDVWDTTTQTIILSYSDSNIYFDEREAYIVVFKQSRSQDKSSTLYIFDTKAHNNHTVVFDFKITCQSQVDIKIAEVDGSTKIFFSAVFATEEEPCNLIIYDVQKEDFISKSKVSCAIRTPKPNQLVGIFGDEIILNAMYGGMGQSNQLWIADKHTGVYKEHNNSPSGTSIGHVIESSNENFLLLHCKCTYTNAEPTIQISALYDEKLSKVLDKKFYSWNKK